MTRTYSPAWSFASQIKAFFAVYPVDPLVIDVPALTSEQGMNAKIAIANSRLGYLTNPQPKGRVVFAMRKIAV